MKKHGIVLLIAAIISIVPFVMADSSHDYTATIGSTSNIIITELDTSFSNCAVASSCDQIASSLNIQNTGNAAPSTGISAAFTTNVATVYGLVSGSDVIPGNNFELNNTALANTLSTTEIVVVGDLGAGVDFNIPADLAIPAGQAAASYTGTVQLSWTA